MSLLWALAATIAVAWRMGGWPMVRAWAPPVACMLWAIPPPFGLHGWITRLFQAIAVDACHHALMAADLLHAVRGLLIALPEHTFFVSEACSGVRSLSAMGAFATVWTVALRRPAWHVALLMLASLGWVLVVNISRILAIVVAFKFRLDLSEGWAHFLLGMVVFLSGLMLIIGIVMERGLIRHFYKRPHADQILVTFGLAIVIQEIIKQVFNKQELSRTLNSLETVARGASLQAAMLSPFFSV